VPTEIRKLRIGLEAHVTLERFDAVVDVSMLFEAAGGGERLATLGARVMSAR